MWYNTDMINGFELIRSARRTVAITISSDGRVVVRAPLSMPEQKIISFVLSKEGWIKKHQNIIKQAGGEKFSKEEIESFYVRAKAYFPDRVREIAKIMGVSYGKITIRMQRTLWGSCTRRGNLNFNCLLTCLSKEIADYVIVHELCHRFYMDHSKKFWAKIGTYLPNYKVLRKQLKEQGKVLLAKI